MTLFNLFITFFKIGLFSFGGGYAMLSMIQQEVVSIHGWVKTKEFINMVAISQATPGPIAINMATYVGFKVNSVLGAVFATLGVITPSVIIMVIITRFFVKFKNNKYVEGAFLGIRPITVGLVAAAAILVTTGAFIDFKSIIIFICAFILSYKKFDPILLIIISGILGYILY
ncbi:chromate transporter [Clostridium novyi B str. ATCC 27606]|uniref:Chromate transporter n=2 Tax=Clostridium TaxID=1485 RepID=A0AA40IVF9_CLONO|nr:MULTISPECIES: chromate transporter [Clostridium]KEI13006.1 chromate transporter [Clostridium novyi B str. NCTC 9691]KEI17465.1 chromate transporter [Clostridium haemolyticum NCTC 9693]KEI17746.1 chromate transporter [Clostridium novyi B str. ATCC 27606]KGN04223.1 chromate transporter [Clostridium haemolyticum NCTC 8350]CAG7839335.1 Chromate transport protein [Clostridium haemolyticum]